MTHALVTLRGLRLAEDPDGWRAIGFRVDEGPVLTADVGGVLLFFVPGGRSGGVVGWTLEPRPTTPIEGLPVVSAPWPTPGTDRGGPPGRPDGHPNGVVAVDHVVVASDDLDATLAAFAHAGLRPRRVAEGLRGDDRRYAFFLAGTAVIEVIAPTAPRRDARPPRFVGVAFASHDLERTAAHLGPLAGPIHDAVQPGRRILTVRTREAGIGVPLAVMSARPRAEVRSEAPPPPNGTRHRRP